MSLEKRADAGTVTVNPLLQQARWCGIVALACGVVAMVGLLLDGIVGICVGSMALSGSGIAALVGSFLWLLSRGAEQEVQDLAGGHGLAVWTYTVEDWNRFARLQRQHRKQEDAILLKSSVGVGAVLGLVLLLAAGSLLAIFVTAAFALVAVSVLVLRPWFENRKYPIADEPVEVRFGRHALRIGGRYFFWNAFAPRLVNVTLEQHEGEVLVLTLASPSRTGQIYNELRLPVPPDRHDEAESLARELLGSAP